MYDSDSYSFWQKWKWWWISNNSGSAKQWGKCVRVAPDCARGRASNAHKQSWGEGGCSATVFFLKRFPFTVVYHCMFGLLNQYSYAHYICALFPPPPPPWIHLPALFVHTQASRSTIYSTYTWQKKHYKFISCSTSKLIETL